MSHLAAGQALCLEDEMSRGLLDRVQMGSTLSAGEGRNESFLDELRESLLRDLGSTRFSELLSCPRSQAEKELFVYVKTFIQERSSPHRYLGQDASCHPYSINRDNIQSLVTQLADGMFGFGPLEPLLADDAITEIMINGPDRMFYEKAGILHEIPSPFKDEGELRVLIDRMIAPLGRRIDESSPTVNARLPQGCRIHAVIPPLALNGPVLTIRKFRSDLLSLDDYVQQGSIEPRVATSLRQCVQARKNIAVIGATSSGKTTLLNALSHEIDPRERIITIEDSAELCFKAHPHVVRLEARPANSEGRGEVSIRDLVINSLRMRPDRIVVGECRGGEAFDMLQALNTGHDGSLTTLHANSAQDAVLRLVGMVRIAEELPVAVIEQQIASAFDLIIQVGRLRSGRRQLLSLSELSFDAQQGSCKAAPFYVRSSDAPGVWL